MRPLNGSRKETTRTPPLEQAGFGNALSLCSRFFLFSVYAHGTHRRGKWFEIIDT